MEKESGRYRIGEVSELLGISAEGLRFYERSGIIQPTKSEGSGYRYYSHLDVSALIRSLTYRNYGFSVKETSKLLNTSEVREVQRIYEDRARAIEREIVLEQKRLQYLREVIGVVDSIKDRLLQCEIVESPGMYRIEFMRQHQIFLDAQGKEEFRRWVDMVPFTFLSMRCPPAGEPDIISALGVMEEYADFLGIKESKYVTYHPPRRAVYTLVKEGNGRFDGAACFAHVHPFLKERGLRTCGDSLARTFVSLNRKESYVRYRQIWIPVEEDTGENL